MAYTDYTDYMNFIEDAAKCWATGDHRLARHQLYKALHFEKPVLALIVLEAIHHQHASPNAAVVELMRQQGEKITTADRREAISNLRRDERLWPLLDLVEPPCFLMRWPCGCKGLSHPGEPQRGLIVWACDTNGEESPYGAHERTTMQGTPRPLRREELEWLIVKMSDLAVAGERFAQLRGLLQIPSYPQQAPESDTTDQGGSITDQGDILR